MNEGNNFFNGKSMLINHLGVSVKGPIFIGRTWAEYIKMFGLETGDLCHGKILDCAAGASSFTAHMSGEGCDVVAVDIMYSEKPDVLVINARPIWKFLLNGIASVDSFVWSFFKDIDDAKEQRNIGL